MTAVISRRPITARLGWGLALTALVLDQVSKHWVLDTLHMTQGGATIALAPFAELKLVWNHGISYGLLQQDSDVGRWLLVTISVIAAIGLAIWLGRAVTILAALSIGLILAGAIGNAIDRAIYGAVIDFIYLYSSYIPFWQYVFNVADASIVAGVAGLLYDSVFHGQRT